MREPKVKYYITTKDLVEEIKKLGFGAGVSCRLIEVTSPVGDTLAKISKVQTHALNVLYPEFITRTTPDVQENLYNMLDRYARTPIEKREEEKKYRLRLDVNNKIENNWQILGKNRNDGAYHKGFVKEEI